MRTAASVPRGMDVPGSFRSPDIPTPERMPVTAGKNTANTGQNPKGAGTRSGGGAANPVGAPPRKNATSENAIAAMMKYWLLSATFAESVATTASTVSVASPTRRGSQAETTGRPDRVSASANPAT